MTGPSAEHGSDRPSGRRVVVGVDESLNARVAVEHAAHRIGPGGRLLVAHAVSTLPEAIHRALSGIDHVRLDIGRQLVDQLVALSGVDAEPHVLEGNPVAALPGLARDSQADEIVVGTRGMGRFAGALGSVAHALLAHAEHPVVVVPRSAADHLVRPHEHGQCTVVVGYDGSPPAQAALRYAVHRATDGRVVAVHAFKPTPDWFGSPHRDRAVHAYQEQGEELLRSLEEEDGLSVELATSLLEGPPARAIVAAADAHDADEIVVGSRGFGPVRGVLGSVSHAVLHEAERPVVVIPADAVPAAGERVR